MLVTESGMVTEVSELQLWKASSGMLLIELGMATDTSDVRSLNDCCSKPV